MFITLELTVINYFLILLQKHIARYLIFKRKYIFSVNSNEANKKLKSDLNQRNRGIEGNV